jgi:RHH-type proline utilization regulon transcriptional repressor/proline dehydrogenase/delta 1-pyrroline-5-carboxylate dehydrogenase
MARAAADAAWADVGAPHRPAIAARLVKGAYWDSEIKRTQEQGFPIPRSPKAATDVSYLACAATCWGEEHLSAFAPTMR